MKNNIKPKVFVGLSGGVDSAVSAALLKKQGYDVTGVFIKAWTPEGYPCSWKEDRRSAMRAAAILDIPFLTLDLEKEYKKEVVDYMIAEYKAGKTPNPDVMCNKEIKFGHFLKFTIDNRADFVATGHYCQTSPPAKLPTKSRVIETPLSLARRGGQGEEVYLLESMDKNKDQSYFLWTLTQEQLKHILFPIGHLQKSEVRKLAAKFGLPQAIRKDSQGVCFLGKVDMKEFLKEYVGAKSGKVLDKNGKVIGEHDGALLYTVGERHGFRIKNKNTDNEPLYVVAKDVEKNTIVVTQAARKKIANEKVWPSVSEETRGLFQEQFFSGAKLVELANANWISGGAPDQDKKYLCRIRYRQEKIGCKISNDGNKLEIILDKPQSGIAPGQSLVLYQKDICLGGGIIKS